MQGIVLIGMPGAGKSTVGKIAAEILGFDFFDGDAEIAKKYPDAQGFLDAHGEKAFIGMEAGIVISIRGENAIVSPGGSIVYSYKAMKHFSSFFKVYLEASLDLIKDHLLKCDIDKRGIVGLKERGLDRLYAERTPLYEKYADIKINVEGKTENEIAALVAHYYSLHLLSLKKRQKIMYVSTNGNSMLSFPDAMLQGLAKDRGLFVPETVPSFSSEEIKLMGNLEYPEIAFVVLRQFIDIPDNELLKMCNDAYNFGVPIEQHGNILIARLDQGPTASFKDFAAQILARLIDYYTKKELIILTATSGDTGGAVASAFSGSKKVKVIILMPADEITEIQRRQMTTICGKITAVLVEGKFDDCQSLAKKAFSEIQGLSSANSINIGRLLPQIVYYFYIYSRTSADSFVVPSGNFGNLVAGLIAKKMGLPVKFIAAVNENDEFPEFLEKGSYSPVFPSRKCLSNAMNVGNPSNLARVIWLYGGLMSEKGEILKMPDLDLLKKDVISASITDDETRKAMEHAYKQGIVLEPHGAVGFAAIQKVERAGKIVLLETAHVAKFHEVLDDLGIKYEVPVTLKRLDCLDEHFIRIKPNIEELKKIINKLQLDSS